MMDADPITLVKMTAEVAAAYIERNHVGAAELPTLIATTHAALAGLRMASKPESAAAKPKPAVPIKKSITDTHLFSLEDGKPYQALKRHLSKLGMTPAEYRAKWGLDQNYPMVAPAYSRSRSALAKELGLGSLRRKR